MLALNRAPSRDLTQRKAVPSEYQNTNYPLQSFDLERERSRKYRRRVRLIVLSLETNAVIGVWS